MFKTQLSLEAEAYRHHMWVAIMFCGLLLLIIAGLCVFIYWQDKMLNKEQQVFGVRESRLQGFTTEELARVTNMRPLYNVVGAE